MYSDTEILTLEGTKKLKDLNEFEDIKSLDFNNDEIVDSTCQVFNTGIKDLFELELIDGTKVKATEDHKFFIKRNNKILELRLKDIKEGDDLICVKEVMYCKKVRSIKFIGKKQTYDLNVPTYHNFILSNGIVTHNSGKSSAAITLAKAYIDKYGFICPKCKNEFFKNIYATKNNPNGVPNFYIPDYVKDDTAWIQCPIETELDLKTGTKKETAGCGHKFKYSQRKRIKWDASKFIAYDNSDVIDKIFNLPIGSPLVCVAGSTKVTIKENNKIHKTVISKLDGRDDFEIMSYNEKDNVFEFKKPDKCIRTHKQAYVYEVELENGKKLKATEDHLFYTKRGYIKLKDLSEDDEILLYSKKCKRCSKEFIPRNTGLDTFCSVHCRSKDKYEDPIKKEQYKLKQQIYIKNNSELIKERRKKYIENNREKYLETKRKERLKNKDKYKARQKIYWQENKVRLSAQNKEWKNNNHQKVRDYYNDRHKILMKTDPKYKIKKNMKRRVNLALKDQGIIKDKSLVNYIGCSVSYLKKYLESKFIEGMSWSNYGKWHVDHIKPCASFDLTNEQELKDCFHYTNLQPLWALDNIKKGYKDVL